MSTDSTSGRSRPGEGHGGRGRLVLVVCRDLEARERMSQHLLARGLIPVPAASAAQAEVVCQKLEPQMAVIDLPSGGDHDGVALVPRLKARLPTLSIAVCTPPSAHAEARYRAEGVEALLPKPLDFAQLERVLLGFARLRLPRNGQRFATSEPPPGP